MEFKGLQAQYLAIKDNLSPRLQRILEKGSFIQGDEVLELEKTLGEYVGVSHCITCGNGTDALTLVLSAWGIGRGDCVFLPDFTFFSTGEAPASLGAHVVFVDVDHRTFNLSPQALEEAIIRILSEGRLRPRAIIAVDLFGLPAEYTLIEAIAKKYKLLLLEDGAQGFGGSISGRRALSFGDAATTSFFPSKPLGCYGDGGAIFTNSYTLAQELYSLRAHGQGKDKYDNVKLGYNSRLDTLQAAVLLTKLQAFKAYELSNMEAFAKIYSEALEGLVQIPKLLEGYKSSWAQYTIVLKSLQEREGLKGFLEAKGIPSMIYYPKTLQNQKAFAYIKKAQLPCPVAEALSQKVLSLPLHGYLKEEEINKLLDAVKGYFINSSF